MRSKAKKILAALAVVVLLTAAGFFVTDLVRVKQYKLPLLFCVPVIEYDNGSVDHYGLGYKVWEDYHPFDKTVEYYVGFWFIPKFVSI